MSQKGGTSGIVLRRAASAMAIAAALVAIGCASFQPPPPSNLELAQPFASHGTLNLCPIPDRPAADVAAESGYAQFAVIALDESSQPIAGIRRADFHVYSESQTFPIEYFRENQGDVPVSIALPIDTSKSMSPKLPAAEQAIGNFINSLSPCDDVTLIAFSSLPWSGAGRNH
jgi:hypothetical protein